MTTLTRKQREIKQREQDILDIASEMLLNEGYFQLNMDRIAERVGVSKGTVYQHFKSKEDMILALETRAMKIRVSLFKRASEYPGSSRERFTAVGVADRIMIQKYPVLFVAEQYCKLEHFSQKFEKKRLTIKESYDQGCNQVMWLITQQAVEEGEFPLTPGANPMEAIFGVWAMSIGAHSLIRKNENLRLDNPYHSLEANYDRIMDSFQWRKLSHEFDYFNFRQELERDYFNEFIETGAI